MPAAVHHHVGGRRHDDRRRCRRLAACRAGPARAAVVLASETRVSRPVSRPERDRDDAGQHRDAEAAADPFAGAERPLHRREDPAADQQRERERGRGAGGIGEQQQRRAGRWRPAVPRRSGSGRGSGRRRAPRAGRSRRRAASDDADGDRASRVIGLPIATDAHPSATSGRVSRSASAGNSSVTPNRASSTIAASGHIRLACDRPAAADRGERGDDGEGQRHADQHRQAAARRRAGRPGRRRRAAPAGCRG